MKHIFKKALITTIITFIPAILIAGTTTLKGSFQGANCTFYNKICPANMTNGHIATEPDFVLVQKGGKYFFIPNLDRALKVKYMHKDVLIEGELKKDALWAEVLKVKDNGKYETVWTYADEKEQKRKAGLR